MTVWAKDELEMIGNTEEIRLSSVRRDGSLRKPVMIWVVRVGDELFVRAVNGREGAWFRGTQVQHEGYIQAGKVGKDVRFEDAAPTMNDQVDAAYRSKYHHYAASIVNSVLTPKSRASTTRLMPR
jgi:hypothetical protein